MNWQSFYGGPDAPEFWGITGLVLAIVIIWSLVWKGLAMWKAARLGSKGWFVVLLVFNTVGILDILYLYIFSRKSKSDTGKLVV